MAVELASGIWWLRLRGVNAYLVDRDDTTLIDAGTPWDGDRIRGELADAGVEVAEIDRVLLTHYDLDHVGTLAGLTPDLDATVHAAGRFDAEILANRRKPPWTNHKGALQRVLGVASTHPSLAIEPVADGAALGPFTAYHTPGHTPGHVAYVSRDLEVAMLGDLVRESGGDLEASSWFVSYDTDDVRESIRRLDADAPSFEIACVGHGEPISPGGSEAFRRLASLL